MKMFNKAYVVFSQAGIDATCSTVSIFEIEIETETKQLRAFRFFIQTGFRDNLKVYIA
jgi:hypothetical protein